jgi:ribonuclease P protein component
MLKKIHRLPIQSTLTKRWRSSDESQWFSIKAFPSSQKTPRFGIIIGKKVSPKAVERNRIKRAIASACQPLLESVSITDFLIIAKPAIKECTKEAITEAIKKSFNKL